MLNILGVSVTKLLIAVHFIEDSRPFKFDVRKS